MVKGIDYAHEISALRTPTARQNTCDQGRRIPSADHGANHSDPDGGNQWVSWCDWEHSDG